MILSTLKFIKLLVNHISGMVKQGCITMPILNSDHRHTIFKNSFHYHTLVFY